MTRTRRARVAAVAFAPALAAAGCGGDFGPQDPGCAVVIGVAPADPVAPAMLVATATVTTWDGSGRVEITWAVTGPGGAVAASPRDPDAVSVDVPADAAGAYVLTAQVTFAGVAHCSDAETVNVRAPNARQAMLRLRYTPRPEHPAPPQDDPTPVVVYGGADMALPDRTLDGGALVAGQLVGPAGPLAGYLRLDGAARPAAAELFAGDDGAYAARVPAGAHDVLVVPFDPQVAPRRLFGQTAAQLSAGYVLDAGDRVDGVVLAPDGTPLVGARVALAAGGLPATVVATDAAGAFAARVRAAAGPLALVVIPPADADLPTLELGPGAAVTVADGATLVVQLENAPRAVFDAAIVRQGGDPLPGGLLTFVSVSTSTAGAVTVDGGAPVPAVAARRVTVVADQAGQVTGVSLPLGVYDVLAEPPTAGALAGDGLSVTTLDLTSGAPPMPPVFSTAGTTPYLVHVTDSASADVPGARVAVVARGLRGRGAGVSFTLTGNDRGMVFAPAIPGMPYDVTVDPPRGVRLARGRTTIIGVGPPGGARVVPLAPALALSGALRFPAGPGQAGVRVSAYCVDCGPGQSPDEPLAETVTGPGGAFTLLVPDPGVEE